MNNSQTTKQHIHERLAWLSIPAAMTTLRLAIAPTLVLFTHLNLVPRFIYVLLIVVAFLSDWLDGVVARRLGIATAWLRRYDIVADVTFYVAVLWAVWRLETETVILFRSQFVLLLALEVSCQIIHLVRFHCLIATHAYLCKFWAIFLAATAISLLGFGQADPLLQITFVLGYIAYADVLLILLFARRPPIDVISSYHVWLVDRWGREKI